MLEIFYWILILLWVVLGIGAVRTNRDYVIIGGGIIGFLLFVIVGLKLFGNPLT